MLPLLLMSAVGFKLDVSAELFVASVPLIATDVGAVAMTIAWPSSADRFKNSFTAFPTPLSLNSECLASSIAETTNLRKQSCSISTSGISFLSKVTSHLPFRTLCSSCTVRPNGFVTFRYWFLKSIWRHVGRHYEEQTLRFTVRRNQRKNRIVKSTPSWRIKPRSHERANVYSLPPHPQPRVHVQKWYGIDARFH